MWSRLADWRVTTDELARAAQPIDDIDRDPARFSAEQTTPIGIAKSLFRWGPAWLSMGTAVP
jgi:hypothetical protein